MMAAEKEVESVVKLLSQVDQVQQVPKQKDDALQDYQMQLLLLKKQEERCSFLFRRILGHWR